MSASASLCNTCSRNMGNRYCAAAISIFPYAYVRCISFSDLEKKEQKEQAPPEEKKIEFIVYSTDDPKKVIRYAKLP